MFLMQLLKNSKYLYYTYTVTFQLTDSFVKQFKYMYIK